jgi:hypothetical protein
MNYFNVMEHNDKNSESVQERKVRQPVLNNFNLCERFSRGDVLIINF